MKYKLVACDLDGTMFGTDYKICEANLKSVKKAVDNGVVFAIASGRPHKSVASIAGQLGLNVKNQYVICFNGASVNEADTGKCVYSLALDGDSARHVIKTAVRHGASAIAYIDGLPHSPRRDNEVVLYEKRIGLEAKIDEGLTESAVGSFDKVLLSGEPDILKKIAESLSDWCFGKAEYVFTDVRLLEYFNAGASKGNALLFLAEKLGIKPDEVIAIGDYFNDISMLEAAGLGVAINGSPEAVRAAAGYVTKLSANEGAVSETVEKFIFGA